MKSTGTVLRKTAAGVAEVQARSHGLARKTFSLLLAVDGRRTLEQMCDTLSAYGDVAGQLAELQALGLIEAVLDNRASSGSDAAGDTRSVPTRTAQSTRTDPPTGLERPSRFLPQTRSAPPTRSGPPTRSEPLTRAGPVTRSGPPTSTVVPNTSFGARVEAPAGAPGRPVRAPSPDGVPPRPAMPDVPAPVPMQGLHSRQAGIGIADVPQPPAEGTDRPVTATDRVPDIARDAPASFTEFSNLIDVRQYTTPLQRTDPAILLREAMTASIGRSIDLESIDLLEAIERADSLAGLGALLPAYFAVTAPRMGATEHARHVEELAAIAGAPVEDFLTGRLGNAPLPGRRPR